MPEKYSDSLKWYGWNGNGNEWKRVGGWVKITAMP